MDNRAIRGYSILAKGDTPKFIDKETFLVPSQSSDKKYKVTHENTWVCDCPDFQIRHQKCKHIYSVEFLLKMRNRLDNDSTLDFAEELTTTKKCQFCNSENIVKNGTTRNKNETKQRFLCRNCKKTFYPEPYLNYIRNPKIITLAFDLYFKGLSLRKITDTLNQFFGVKIHHETVRRWLNKFTEKMKEYTKQFKPKVSGGWHTDEQMIKVKGKWLWNWNVMDEHTRFLIASNITKARNIKDAQEVFQKAKEVTKGKPEFMITDGLNAYEKAIRKEFWRHPQTKHVRLTSIRDKRINNNIIERFHSTFRERDKVMRGFKSESNPITNGFGTYYNFIRKHQGLNGLTPSQKADIELNLGQNRWLDLLRQSLKN
jgi:putative transposase